MTSLEQVKKAQAEQSKKNKIIDIVLPTLSELYGAPSWLVKPLIISKISKS